MRRASAAHRSFAATDLPWAHALNEAHAVELSSMAPAAFAALVARACTALVAAPEAGFLLAFQERPAAHSPNFDWLAARCAHFVYVDRIVIAPAARGRGLARVLYEGPRRRGHPVDGPGPPGHADVLAGRRYLRWSTGRPAGDLSASVSRVST